MCEERLFVPAWMKMQRTLMTDNFVFFSHAVLTINFLNENFAFALLFNLPSAPISNNNNTITIKRMGQPFLL